MSYRNLAIVLTLAAGMLAATGASAFFSATSTRPPPYGGNGLSANGFSLNGLSLDVSVLKSITLADGTVVTLD